MKIARISTYQIDLPLLEGKYNWSGGKSVSGANVITVTATDSVGNMTATAITVYQDTANPTVTITLPTTSPTFTTGSDPIALGGTATDDVEVSSVTWVNSEGGSGSATLSGPATSPT